MNTVAVCDSTCEFVRRMKELSSKARMVGYEAEKMAEIVERHKLHYDAMNTRSIGRETRRLLRIGDIVYEMQAIMDKI